MAAILASLAIWFVWSSLQPKIAQSDTGSLEVVNYTVQPNDTLWFYASNITPEGKNVSDTVDLLMRLNDLDSAALQPGQQLLVPAQH